MLKLYYESDAIRLSYDEAWQLGVGEWKGFVSSDEARSTALYSLDFVNEHGITRWLADRTNMKAIRQQDQQWTVEYFIPKLVASPLRRLANVVSEDIFNRMAIEQMIKRSGDLGNIVMREFDNVADALEWLKKPLDAEDTATAGDVSA